MRQALLLTFYPDDHYILQPIVCFVQPYCLLGDFKVAIPILHSSTFTIIQLRSLMENTAPKKKMSGFKLFFLLVIGFILLSFLMQGMGMKVMNTKEKEEIIQRPHNG